MNWVGGSRNRFLMKNDAKRQREFFEKRKMQQRLKNLGIPSPASPRGTSSGSLDLMTLFIVNQIASKKENKGPPKVAVLGRGKGGSKHKRNEPLVLPMSPCSPSQLSLAESQSEISVQEARKKKHVIPQGFKCQQLSPVLESAFSDNSASDYLPSPFSFTSSASSGQGMFPLQLNLQQRSQMQAQLSPHCFPPPWDTSGLEQTKFQPFSQPRGMTDSIPWSCGSIPHLYQLETPTAPQVLFGRPEPDNTEPRDHARHEVTSLNQPEDREPMLDFTLNQSETEQQVEEDVFRGFSTEERQREASHFGRGQSKIYLKDETPAKSSTPQTVPDSQRMGVECCSFTDTNFSCFELNSSSMNGCNCSLGYLSSDSDDEKEGCQAASPCIDQACCAASLNPNVCYQGNPKQRHAQHRLLTPPLKPKTNFRDDQKAGSNSQRMGSHTAQVDSPQALAQTQSSCRCRKASKESRDAETQTSGSPTAETCDASTQCSFVADSAMKAAGLNLCLPPVDVSVQHPATGRQTDTAEAPNTQTPSPGSKHTPWSQKKPRAASLSGSRAINKFTANNSDDRVILQRPINPFLDALTDGRERVEMKEGN
ncbi:uncharacterized protein redic1 isoform X1 [Chaetodon auriga]|uniref:uncharacterized protein redic1 isoform X1 n=1 Tax=Chaetodon auriga TaxID=39042 RepID=UPI004032D265